MIDPDAQRRAFAAVLETQCADAHATTAADACEWLREDMSRLRKELLVISSIAAELYSTLLATNPERARYVSQSLLWQEYQEDSHFPNIRDLLVTFSRLR